MLYINKLFIYISKVAISYLLYVMFHQTMKTVNTESQRLCTCISYVLMYISIFYIHYMYFKIDLL